MTHLALAFGLAVALTGGQPATSAGGACDAPAFRAFDFWIGSWDIDQEILRPDGSYAHFPASNRVEPAASGCALVEHWRGIVQFFWEGMSKPDSLAALSVRSFDPGTNRWSIYWLDSRHPAFGDPFVGTFEDGRGTFARDVRQADGSISRRRIVFQSVAPNAVEWSLDVSRDAGRTWTTVWRMHFRRAGTL